MTLERLINKLVDEACEPKAKKHAHEFSFGLICIKIRNQMRRSGMTNKEILIEMNKVERGNYNV